MQDDEEQTLNAIMEKEKHMQQREQAGELKLDASDPRLARLQQQQEQEPVRDLNAVPY